MMLRTHIHQLKKKRGRRATELPKKEKNMVISMDLEQARSARKFFQQGDMKIRKDKLAVCIEKNYRHNKQSWRSLALIKHWNSFTKGKQTWAWNDPMASHKPCGTYSRSLPPNTPLHTSPRSPCRSEIFFSKKNASLSVRWLSGPEHN